MRCWMMHRSQATKTGGPISFFDARKVSPPRPGLRRRGEASTTRVDNQYALGDNARRKGVGDLVHSHRMGWNSLSGNYREGANTKHETVPIEERREIRKMIRETKEKRKEKRHCRDGITDTARDTAHPGHIVSDP